MVEGVREAVELLWAVERDEEDVGCGEAEEEEAACGGGRWGRWGCHFLSGVVVVLVVRKVRDGGGRRRDSGEPRLPRREGRPLKL